MENKKVDLSAVSINASNPRTITEQAFDKLINSLLEFPRMLDLRPIVVDEAGVALGGNMRLRALQRIAGMDAAEIRDRLADVAGLTDGERNARALYWQRWQKNPVATIAQAEQLTDYEKRQFIIKDNVGFGDWDWDELANNWDGEELAAWGLDNWDAGDEPGEGEGATQQDHSTPGALQERFVVPPFSVLDTRQGYWQDRKKAWLERTGNLSESRDGEFGTVSGNQDSLFNSINGGTSNFDPVLAECLMTWFCPAGGRILDPFGGEQTKGVVAGELGLQYSAVEIRPEQVDINRAATAGYDGVKYFCGDSNKISELITERGFDLCFTSPPYYDLEVYSKTDLSALGTYEEFMAQYENIFRQCVDMLAEDAFLAIKICEIRDKKTGVYRNFVGDNIALFKRLGLKYYNEVILLNAIGTAAVRANKSMQSRKLVKVHQNILVFYKGDIKRAVARLQPIEYNENELRDEGECD